MKIYRVNLTNLKITEELVKDTYMLLGGRGLTSQMILDEVDPTCDAIGKHNKLVIAPGLLSGTSAPSSGRVSVGAKSPLTGGIKESNSGGTVAQKIGKLGIKAIVIEGMPSGNDFYKLVVDKDGAKLEICNELVGKGNYETMEILLDKYGKRSSFMTIGPAGEFKLQAASIAISDPEYRPTRHCGRGGLGAVMGSKKLKAIVINDEGTKPIEIYDNDKFKKAAKDFAKMLLDHPVSGGGLPKYGTAVLINILNEAGGLPTKNFATGRFDKAGMISGETVAEKIEERGGKAKHACHPGCVMQCSQIYNDKDGNYLTSGFEYETIWAFGSNSMISDIDVIAMADRMCDDTGIDTIEIGNTIAVAMEGGLIEFGDTKGVLNLIGEVFKGSPVGRIIGNGAGFTGKAFGVTRVPVVKNQAMPAYDPRSVKGQGVTYATTPMGADHTAGYAVTANILGVGGTVDPLKKEGQIELSRNLQIATAAIDATGFCLFIAFAVIDNPEALPKIVDMLNAMFNLELTGDDVTNLGISILKAELEFNRKAGFTALDDRLPEYFTEEKFAPHNTTFDFTDEELDSVLKFD
ncbi:MAG: aldehyde ferredoxin oxidoreductase C-terminal domain-containing protein [Bacillota bacterium]|nr:aldehyde ferredoxin oxidoreductase C-terminal domain-containing protein [Bacillota bacterium]